MEKLKNLLSRKFLITLVSNAVVGASTMGLDNTNAKIIGGICIIIINAVYVIAEGKIDKESLSVTVNTIADSVTDMAKASENKTNDQH